MAVIFSFSRTPQFRLIRCQSPIVGVRSVDVRCPGGEAATHTFAALKCEGVAYQHIKFATSVPTKRLPTVVDPKNARLPVARSRLAAGVVACFVVVAGLAARFLLPDPLGDAIGGVLYASLIFLLCILLTPRARTLAATLVALAIAVGIEVLQLTPWPAAAAAAWWPSRLIIGTGFSALDLVTATVGVLGSGVVDGFVRSRQSLTQRDSPKP